MGAGVEVGLIELNRFDKSEGFLSAFELLYWSGLAIGMKSVIKLTI
jgi:hypothetical protein